MQVLVQLLVHHIQQCPFVLDGQWEVYNQHIFDISLLEINMLEEQYVDSILQILPLPLSHQLSGQITIPSHF